MGYPVEHAPGQSIDGPTLSDVGIVPAPSEQRIISTMGKASGWERDISPVLQADEREVTTGRVRDISPVLVVDEGREEEEQNAALAASVSQSPREHLGEEEDEFFSSEEGGEDPGGVPDSRRKNGTRGEGKGIGKDGEESDGDKGKERGETGQRSEEAGKDWASAGEGVGWKDPSQPSSSVGRGSVDSVLMEGITLYGQGGKSDDGGSGDDQLEWPHRMLSGGEIAGCIAAFRHNELLGLNRPVAGVAGTASVCAPAKVGGKRSRALMSEGRDIPEGTKRKVVDVRRSPIPVSDSEGVRPPTEVAHPPGVYLSRLGDRAVTVSSDEEYPGGMGSEGRRGGKRQGKKRRAKKGAAYVETEEEEDDPLPLARSGLVSEETERSSVPDIYAQGVEHLSAIEGARRKSKNLQGGQSKAIKDGVTALRELLTALSERAQAREEVPAWMSKQNQDLRAELLAKDQRMGKLQEEVESLRSDVRGLTKELRKKVWRVEKEYEKDATREKEEGKKVTEEERKKREEREKKERERDEERLRVNEEKRRAEEREERRRSEERKAKERKERDQQEKRELEERIRSLTADPLASVPSRSYAGMAGSGVRTSVQGGVESLDRMVAELLRWRRELEGLRRSEEKVKASLAGPPSRPGPRVVGSATLNKRVRVVGQGAPGGTVVPPKPREEVVKVVEVAGLSSQPKAPEGAMEVEWEEPRSGRRKKRKKKRKEAAASGDGALPAGGPPPPGRQAGASASGPAVPSTSVGAGKQTGAAAPKPGPPGRRVPRSAAVTITGVTEGFSYSDAMKRARESIPLAELGLDGKTRVRKAQNGGMLIEIQGQEGKAKADILARRVATAGRSVGSGGQGGPSLQTRGDPGRRLR